MAESVSIGAEGTRDGAAVVAAETQRIQRPAAPPEATTGGTFRSLRHFDFRLMWFGTLFASAGMWIQQVTTGWLAYQLTGSPFLLGAINGFRAIPLLVLGPLGGVAADRMDRRKLMFATQAF